MSIDVIIAGWQETFKSAASRLAGDFRVSARQLAADLNVSCQPAGRRHFLFLIYISSYSTHLPWRKQMGCLEVRPEGYRPGMGVSRA